MNLDLVSFVAGVGPTASFTPGGSTPAPLNVTHTGLTDGTGPTTASNNMAEIYNRLMLQVASVIVKSGLSIDNNNWTQLGDAVQAIANASAGAGGYETSAHAASTYATQATVTANKVITDALIALNASNTFVGQIVSGGTPGSLSLPAGGMWRGLWVGRLPTDSASALSSATGFDQAGGTVIAPTYAPIQVFAVRYA